MPKTKHNKPVDSTFVTLTEAVNFEKLSVTVGSALRWEVGLLRAAIAGNDDNLRRMAANIRAELAELPPPIIDSFVKYHGELDEAGYASYLRRKHPESSASIDECFGVLLGERDIRLPTEMFDRGNPSPRDEKFDWQSWMP